MGCGASLPGGPGSGNVQQIFVSRYKPSLSDDMDMDGADAGDTDGDTDDAPAVTKRPPVTSPTTPICPACGMRGTPYCAMTGQRHSLGSGEGWDKEDADERADRIYLMGIYDSPTLLNELLSYVGHGTSLEKWSSTARPHLRQFWLEAPQVPQPAAAPQGGAKPCGATLWWKGRRQRMESAPLRDMRELVLGRHTAAFRAAAADTASGVRSHAPEVQDLYLRSFSIIFRHGAPHPTLDLTAASVQEFEAWVISLTHVTDTAPRWGDVMDISDSPVLRSLDVAERDVCAAHCIPPALYLQVKHLLRRKRDRVHAALGWRPPAAAPPGDLAAVCAEDVASDSPRVQALKAGITPPRLNAASGALYVTKGELRYWTRCDIFRTCAIWCLLERKGIIYDPDFQWASPAMPLSTPLSRWRWAPAAHAAGPRLLRRTISAALLAQRLRRAALLRTPPSAAPTPASASARRASPASASPRSAAGSRGGAAAVGSAPALLPDDLLFIVFEYLPRFP